MVHEICRRDYGLYVFVSIRNFLASPENDEVCGLLSLDLRVLINLNPEIYITLSGVRNRTV
jgi:hypothetical protein